MEGTKHLMILVILLGTFSIPISAQNNRDSIFFHCYTTSSMEKWKQTMEQMDQELDNRNDYNQLFEVTLAWYGYIGYCIGNGLEDEAASYLKSGWKHLNNLTEHAEAGAAAYSLKSGFYGFEMGLARYKAMILGPRSVSALNRAAEIDSTNIHYHVEKGNQMYYLPSLLGGDKEVALNHYIQAVRLMEAGSRYHTKHWFFLNTLVTLGNTYETTGNIEKARQTYQKIKILAPHFKWFNEEVWPKFIKKHGIK